MWYWEGGLEKELKVEKGLREAGLDLTTPPLSSSSVWIVETQESPLVTALCPTTAVPVPMKMCALWKE